MDNFSVQDGFSRDGSQFFFKDLVFHVETSVRRKRTLVAFDCLKCRFILKINAQAAKERRPEFVALIKRMLNSNYDKFQQLLQENVQFKEFSSNNDCQQYNTDDIVYLNGLPYRLEVEYEIKPDLSRKKLKLDDSLPNGQAQITQKPQQLVLMMVPEGSSRYAGKFEYLYEQGYYNKALLNELPVLITEASAERFNEDIEAAKAKIRCGLQSIGADCSTDPLQLLQAQDSKPSITSGSEPDCLSITSDSVFTALSAQSAQAQGEPTYTANGWLSYDAILANGQLDRALGSEIKRVMTALPVKASLLLPPRHMELLEALYLKRAPLEYAWLFTLDQDSKDFADLVQQYGRAIKTLTTELYCDLWNALNQGSLCTNKFLLDPESQFLWRLLYSPHNTPSKYWVFGQVATLAKLLNFNGDCRFFGASELWTLSKYFGYEKLAKFEAYTKTKQRMLYPQKLVREYLRYHLLYDPQVPLRSYQEVLASIKTEWEQSEAQAQVKAQAQTSSPMHADLGSFHQDFSPAHLEQVSVAAASEPSRGSGVLSQGDAAACSQNLDKPALKPDLKSEAQASRVHQIDFAQDGDDDEVPHYEPDDLKNLEDLDESDFYESDELANYDDYYDDSDDYEGYDDGELFELLGLDGDSETVHGSMSTLPQGQHGSEDLSLNPQPAINALDSAKSSCSNLQSYKINAQPYITWARELSDALELSSAEPVKPVLLTKRKIFSLDASHGTDYLAHTFQVFSPKQTELLLQAMQLADLNADPEVYLSPEYTADSHWEMTGYLQQLLRVQRKAKLQSNTSKLLQHPRQPLQSDPQRQSKQLGPSTQPKLSLQTQQAPLAGVRLQDGFGPERNQRILSLIEACVAQHSQQLFLEPGGAQQCDSASGILRLGLHLAQNYSAPISSLMGQIVRSPLKDCLPPEYELKALKRQPWEWCNLTQLENQQDQLMWWPQGSTKIPSICRRKHQTFASHMLLQMPFLQPNPFATDFAMYALYNKQMWRKPDWFELVTYLAGREIVADLKASEQASQIKQQEKSQLQRTVGPAPASALNTDLASASKPTPASASKPVSTPTLASAPKVHLGVASQSVSKSARNKLSPEPSFAHHRQHELKTYLNLFPELFIKYGVEHVFFMIENDDPWHELTADEAYKLRQGLMQLQNQQPPASAEQFGSSQHQDAPWSSSEVQIAKMAEAKSAVVSAKEDLLILGVQASAPFSAQNLTLKANTPDTQVQYTQKQDDRAVVALASTSKFDLSKSDLSKFGGESIDFEQPSYDELVDDEDPEESERLNSPVQRDRSFVQFGAMFKSTLGIAQDKVALNFKGRAPTESELKQHAKKLEQQSSRLDKLHQYCEKNAQTSRRFGDLREVGLIAKEVRGFHKYWDKQKTVLASTYEEDDSAVATPYNCALEERAILNAFDKCKTSQNLQEFYRLEEEQYAQRKKQMFQDTREPKVSLDQLCQALHLGRAGLQFNLHQELQESKSEIFGDLLFERLNADFTGQARNMRQEQAINQAWADSILPLLYHELPDSIKQLMFQGFSQLLGYPSAQKRSALKQELYADKLLPGMCWTLGANDQEIDPAEAVAATQDIFFVSEEDLTSENYFATTGMPMLDCDLELDEPMEAWNLVCAMRENSNFKQLPWKQKFWQRTLVRPGVIKLKIGYRHFGDLDSLKERQYRFDVLMFYGRELLMRQVLRVVKLLMVGEPTPGIKAASNMHLVELTASRSHASGLKSVGSLPELFFIAFGDYFDRCIVTSGMNAQGRCSIKRTSKTAYTSVLSISQDMVAFPLIYILSVIMHEANHLKYFNHSTWFKNSLKEICPFYNELNERWLELKPMKMKSPIRQRLLRVDVTDVNEDLFKLYPKPLHRQQMNAYWYDLAKSMLCL